MDAEKAKGKAAKEKSRMEQKEAMEEKMNAFTTLETQDNDLKTAIAKLKDELSKDGLT